MEPRRLPDGRIRIPVRAEDGDVVGDGWLDIGPEHPEFEAWDADVKKNESRAGSAAAPR